MTEHLLPLLNYFINEVRLVTVRLWGDFPTKAPDPPKLFNKSSRESYWKFTTLSHLPMLSASKRMNYSICMTMRTLQIHSLPKGNSTLYDMATAQKLQKTRHSNGTVA